MANLTSHTADAAAAQIKLLEAERAQLVREIADAEKKVARLAVIQTMITALTPPESEAPAAPASPAA